MASMDEAPAGMAMSPSYRAGHRAFGALGRAGWDLRYFGQEHQETAARAAAPGGYIVAANHVSFLDPPFVGCGFDRPLRILARRSLFANRVAGAVLGSWGAIPLDQDRADPKAFRTMFQALRGGESVLLFPEGQRARDGALHPPQAGVGLMLARARAPALPARIFGAEQALPRGARMPRPAAIRVAFGPPLIFSEADLAAARGKDGRRELALRMMAAIAAIREPRE